MLSLVWLISECCLTVVSSLTFVWLLPGITCLTKLGHFLLCSRLWPSRVSLFLPSSWPSAAAVRRSGLCPAAASSSSASSSSRSLPPGCARHCNPQRADYRSALHGPVPPPAGPPEPLPRWAALLRASLSRSRTMILVPQDAPTCQITSTPFLPSHPPPPLPLDRELSSTTSSSSCCSSASWPAIQHSDAVLWGSSEDEDLHCVSRVWCHLDGAWKRKITKNKERERERENKRARAPLCVCVCVCVEGRQDEVGEASFTVKQRPFYCTEHCWHHSAPVTWSSCWSGSRHWKKNQRKHRFIIKLSRTVSCEGWEVSKADMSWPLESAVTDLLPYETLCDSVPIVPDFMYKQTSLSDLHEYDAFKQVGTTKRVGNAPKTRLTVNEWQSHDREAWSGRSLSTLSHMWLEEGDYNMTDTQGHFVKPGFQIYVFYILNVIFIYCHCNY